MPRHYIGQLENNHRWRHSYIILHYLIFSFEISSPCTNINSRTRLYNASASPVSRLRSAGSLATTEYTQRLRYGRLDKPDRKYVLMWRKAFLTPRLSFFYFEWAILCETCHSCFNIFFSNFCSAGFFNFRHCTRVRVSCWLDAMSLYRRPTASVYDFIQIARDQLAGGIFYVHLTKRGYDVKRSILFTWGAARKTAREKIKKARLGEVKKRLWATLTKGRSGYTRI